MAPTFWNRIQAQFETRRSGSAPSESTDADRNRRAFIAEMIDRNPDAFASEADVQNMLHMFPGRF